MATLLTGPIIPPDGPDPEDWDGPSHGHSHGLTGLYTKIFFLVLGVLTVPILLAALFNGNGWPKAVLGVMIVSALVDVWLILQPLPFIGVSLVDLLRQRKKPGANATEVEKQEWASRGKWLVTRRFYSIAVIVFFWKFMALFVLWQLPLDDSGDLALAILALIIPVIIGSSMTDEAWKGHPVTRTIFLACSCLLTGVVVYWAVVTVWPEFRPFKAKAITTEVEKEIRRQHETTIKLALEGAGPIKGIARKIKEMDGHLTLEERLAKLTPEERRVWEAASSNTADRALHGLKEQAKKLDQKVKGWSKDGSPATAAGAINAPAAADTSNQNLTRWPQSGYGDFTPGKESMSLGNFEAGAYCIRGSGEYQLRILYADGTSTDVKLDKAGRWVGAGHGTQLPYSGADAHPAPFGNQPIGAVYALVNGQPVESSIDGHRFTVGAGEEIRLDVNAPTHAANRVTNGVLKLRVEKC